MDSVQTKCGGHMVKDNVKTAYIYVDPLPLYIPLENSDLE